MNIISTKQAAQVLGVNRSTIARWVHTDKLVPVLKLAGKRGGYLFFEKDIERKANEING